MAGSSNHVIRQILQNYRHLMTEPERCADRAFAFQQKADETVDMEKKAEMAAAVQEALGDAAALELFRKGRQRFLEDLAQRVLAEHGSTLPRCEACGEVLKKPNPRDCFDCDFQAGRAMDH